MCPQRQHLRPCVILSVLLSLWMDLTSGEINIQLIPQYPVTGGSVTLTVTGVTGNIFSFIWYKGPNTTPECQILTYLPDDPSPLIPGRLYVSRATPFPNASLLISDLYITDSGNYIVGIQTDKPAELTSVTLTVYERVSKPTVTASTSPREDVPFTLTCDTSNAERILWSRDRASLPAHVLSTDNRTITFSRGNRADSGDYTCEAQNKVSNSISDPYTVTVCYGPENVQIAVTVSAGSVISLSCSADSVPPPIYQWRVNNTYIKQSKDHFDRVFPEDQGTYTCVVNNTVTQRSAAASVLLYGNPSTGISSALNAGSIVGITVGVNIGVVLIIIAGVALYRRHVSKRQKEGPVQSPVYENGMHSAKPQPAKEESSYMGLQFSSEETYEKLKI